MDNRYCFSNENKINDIIILDEKESHHFLSVRRGKIGEQVVCINGDGNEYIGKVSAISKKNITIKIEKISKDANETNKKYTLFLALSKYDALEESICKATQLNISDIVLFKSEFMPMKFDEKKLDKFHTIIKQTAKQCERATFPEISCVKFDEMIKLLKIFDEIIFAYEDANDEYIAKNNAKNIAIIVGNEAGFSQNEVKLINNANAKPISLGKTILRAPTAVTSLISIVMYTNGEFKR